MAKQQLLGDKSTAGHIHTHTQICSNLLRVSIRFLSHRLCRHSSLCQIHLLTQMKMTFIMTYMFVRLNLTGRLNKSNWICHSTQVCMKTRETALLLYLDTTNYKHHCEIIFTIIINTIQEDARESISDKESILHCF